MSFKINVTSNSSLIELNCKSMFIDKIMIKCILEGYSQQPNDRDNASLCAVMFSGEMHDVGCSTLNKVVCQVDGM